MIHLQPTNKPKNKQCTIALLHLINIINYVDTTNYPSKKKKKKKKKKKIYIYIYIYIYKYVYGPLTNAKHTSPGGLEPPTFRLPAERAIRLRQGDTTGQKIGFHRITLRRLIIHIIYTHHEPDATGCSQFRKIWLLCFTS